MSLHSTFFIGIFICFANARSMKDSVMVGKSGLQVIAKGHLLIWKTKSLEPSLVVWLSGLFILFHVGGKLKIRVVFGASSFLYSI